MGVLEDLADALARDTIAEADRLGKEELITEVAKALGATSTTMEESYLTSIRIRLAEKRARDFLKDRVRQEEARDAG